MNNENVQEIIRIIKERTLTPSYKLSVNVDRKPTILDTKFGGKPYWNAKLEYPTDSNGNPLIMLAQLNMKDFAGDELLPENGMIQFYIAADDVFGIDFDDPDSQKDFRVVYHENLDDDIEKIEELVKDVPVAEEETEDYYVPLERELAVEVERVEISLSAHDYRYELVFMEIAKELNYEFEGDSLYNILTEEQFNEVYESEESIGHKVFGSPYFTQTDPREYSEELRRYDTLLFQMDSDWKEGKYEIIWGDSGVANFFINREDLKEGRFDKILYNWDCF